MQTVTVSPLPFSHPAPLQLDDLVLQLSIGDIVVVARLNWLKTGSLDGIPATIVDGYPLLAALVESVMAEPRIVEYTVAKAK